VIVAADDMGDAHVVIVDHDRQHVGRRAVGAQQDEIVELGVADRDAALDQIVDHRLAFARGLDPHDEGRAGRRRGGIGIAPALSMRNGRRSASAPARRIGLEFLGVR
jgi:hypothetical protein